MFKNLTQVYCIIICLIASIVMLITIGITLNSITTFLFPEYKYIRELSRFSSDEKYIEDKKLIITGDKQQVQLIKEKRIAEKEDYINGIKGNAISNIIDCFTWLITSMFFFFVHWKLYKRSASN